MTGKEWVECPCGESISVSGSDFGRAVLAAWRSQHATHEKTTDTKGSEAT
ncbi:hypothetical protein [Microbacterium sp. VKM Ac-2923]|nr:hypothetical protein [Microbacterium sp. VKM Ac-2923]MCJ1709261.1 hypothetical protein [Microbacterium sp. VKM Ac-2923]